MKSNAARKHSLTEEDLLRRYEGRPLLTAAEVCRDFFPHLTLPKFIRNVNEGKIKLPVLRMDASAKAARAVHISDLADYIDQRRTVARREMC